MTSVIQNIIAFSQKPFKENLSFFLRMWLLVSAADVFFWSIHGDPIFGAYMGIHGFVYVYVIVLVYGIFEGGAKRIYQIAFIALGLLNLIADSFAHYILHTGFTKEIVAIIRGTNPNEGTEFMSLYLKPDIIAFIIICIALLPVINWLVKKKSVVERVRWIPSFLSVILLLSVGYIGFRHSKNWETVFLHKILLFKSYNPPVELTPYRSTPSIQTNGDSPTIIALIIGESLSRNHCSLYGYDKITTPRLAKMVDDSLVYTFSNVSAAYYMTGGAFPLMMSTYSGSDNDIGHWYESILWEDITTAMGYRSVWISNQSSSGLYDNPVDRKSVV